MRANSSAEDQVHTSAASERLTGLGLPRSSAGWVPDQPALAPAPPVVADPPSEVAPPAAHPQPPSEAGSLSDLIRAAAADRAPLWATGLIERATASGVITAVVVLLLLVVGGVMLVRHDHPAGAPSYPSASFGGQADSPAPDPVSSASSDGASIVVDVGGRVRKPGLVTLPSGARVADAIDAAGGPLRRRELDRIDLAQRVTDGQLLLVGVKPAAGAAGGPMIGASADGTSAPVSLSTATIDQLETLPGVGPVTAQKIIDWRTAHGGFTSVEQLQQVSGIGPAHYAEISPLVTP